MPGSVTGVVVGIVEACAGASRCVGIGTTCGRVVTPKRSMNENRSPRRITSWAPLKTTLTLAPNGRLPTHEPAGKNVGCTLRGSTPREDSTALISRGAPGAVTPATLLSQAVVTISSTKSNGTPKVGRLLVIAHLAAASQQLPCEE